MDDFSGLLEAYDKSYSTLSSSDMEATLLSHQLVLMSEEMNLRSVINKTV